MAMYLLRESNEVVIGNHHYYRAMVHVCNTQREAKQLFKELLLELRGTFSFVHLTDEQIDEATRTLRYRYHDDLNDFIFQVHSPRDTEIRFENTFTDF